MRVQPDLPSSPLLATVMSRSGSACSACSAANSPAPPEPRIRMSVLRRSSMGSRRAEKERDGCRRRHRRDTERHQLLLPARHGRFSIRSTRRPPSRCTASRNSRAGLGKFDRGVLRPRENAVERRLAFDGEAERQKVQRQKEGEQDAGDAVHLGRDPQRIGPVGGIARLALMAAPRQQRRAVPVREA